MPVQGLGRIMETSHSSSQICSTELENDKDSQNGRARRHQDAADRQDEEPGETEARNYLFDEILSSLSKLDAFNNDTCPTAFVVYAHDNPKYGEAYADCVIRLIRWLDRVHTHTVSDRKPLLNDIRERDGDSAAAVNILSNQLRALPKPKTKCKPMEDGSTLFADKVILFGSAVLEAYCKHDFAGPYMDEICKLYEDWKASGQEQRMLERKINDYLDDQQNCEGFHHVLTEIAFLRLRHRENGGDHSIIPVALNSIPTSSYLPFGRATDLWLKLESPARLHKLFFKILTQYHLNQKPLIQSFVECYERTLEIWRASTTKERREWRATVGEEIFRTYKRMEEIKIVEYRLEERRRQLRPEILKDPVFISRPKRNDRFVERVSIRESVEEHYRNVKQGVQPRIGLLGVSGSGKTQIALDIAHEWSKDHHVFWIDGTSETSFLASYSKIANQAQPPSQDFEIRSACLESRKWLDSTASQKWLLVIDGLDKDFPSLYELLPEERGVIIVTSRDNRLEGTKLVNDGCGVTVGSMKKSEALSMIKRQWNEWREEWTDANDSIEPLLQRLGYLPLAIEHLRNLIHKKRMTIRECIDMIDDGDDAIYQLLQRESQSSEKAYNIPSIQVLNVFVSSFKAVRDQNQLAWKILQVVSFLHHEKVPEDLLAKTRLFSSVGGMAFTKALEDLESFGLIDRQSYHVTTMCGIHSLIGLVANCRSRAIDTEEHRRAYESALEMVQSSFDSYANKSFLVRINESHRYLSSLSHAEAVLRIRGNVPVSMQSDLITTAEHRVRYQAAKASLLAGRLRQAEDLIRCCDRYFESRMADSPEVMVQIDIVFAHILRELGRYRGAQSRCESALRRFEVIPALLRQRYADLKVSALMIYGTTLRENYHYRKAKETYGEVLKLCKTGDEFYKEAELYASMCQGSILIAEGRSSEALTDLQSAQKSWKFTDKDPMQYLFLAEIAEAQLQQGKYELAKKSYEEASTGIEKDGVLGAMHPRSLLIRASYGSALSMTNEHESARKVLETVLERQTKILGEWHPRALVTRRYLSMALNCLGEHGRAVEQYDKIVEALQNTSKAEGQPLHPSYYEIVKLKADANRDQGKLEGDINKFKAALDGYREASKAPPDEGSNIRAWSVWVDLGRANTYILMSELDEARNLLKTISVQKSALNSEADFVWLPDIESVFDDLVDMLEAGKRRQRGRRFSLLNRLFLRWNFRPNKLGNSSSSSLLGAKNY